MTFTTLQLGATERPLADWGISQASREVSNQAHDHFACDLIVAMDTADPIPYGTQIILRIGRVNAAAVNAAGLPVSGITSWSGGQVWFVGWRVDEFRTGGAASEKLDFKFAGPWEYFFERIVFAKLQMSYNGTANVAEWRRQVVLGLSLNSLVGPADTIPGTNATNLMSIRQQVAEIIAYCAGVTDLVYGAPAVQSDALTSDSNGNYQLTNTYPGAAFSSGVNLCIPDFIAGAYSASGQSSASQAQAGTTAALMTTVLRMPLDSVNNITCAEALRRTCKWIGPLGEAVFWFDYTTTSGGNPCPTLHISTRDQLPAVTLPFPAPMTVYDDPLTGPQGEFGYVSTKIKRRDDLIPQAVALEFRITGTFNDTPYEQVIQDIAGIVSSTAMEGIGLPDALYTLASFAGGTPITIDSAYGSGKTIALQNLSRYPGVPVGTVNMTGPSNAVARCNIVTMPVNLADPSTGGTAAAFWQKLFPEFLTMASSPTFFSSDSSNITVTVDNPGNANTNQPNDGTDLVAGGLMGTYQYLLVDGQIAPWMLSGNTSTGAPVQVVQAVINVKFAVAQTTIVGSTILASGSKPYAEKTARVTLVSIPGGFYQCQTGFAAGEVIPYGLAGYIFTIGQIPQYEGAITIQETEIADQCPMGNNLNLSGNLAEWSTMAACVQQISYDLTAGKTTLSFGPAAHLGATDLVERLRVNRYPIRPFYGNGGNVTNSPSASAALGNSVTQRAPTAGVEHSNQQILPVNLSDWGSHATAYTTGVPGITFDTRSSGQPNYGAISGLGVANVPTIHLQAGSEGSYSKCIRISLADLVGANKQAYFQPISVCVLNDEGAPTTMTQYILATNPE